jgi:Eukaryotic aspartyl protease
MGTRKSGMNSPLLFDRFYFIVSNKNILFLQKCKSENCLDRCTFYTRRSRSIEYTGLRHSVSYGDACVDTKVWKDTVEFAGVQIPHSYFGVANRMNGFDHGFGKRSWKTALVKEKMLLILRPCLLKPLLNLTSDK